MSNHHGHHHSRRRRKNPISEFLDRLRGRKHQKSYHRTDFPGINLPKDYDPVAWRETGRFEKGSSKSGEDPEQETFDKEVPENLHEIRVPEERLSPRPSSSKKKKSIFGAFDLYLKQRELRREERYKEKLRRKHRHKSEQEFRKINKGPGLRKKLFTLPGEELEGGADAKLIPLLSQRNPVYRNMTITVNSTLIFITTYILTYLFYWLTCMLVASFYGLDSSLFYYDLKFNDHSPMWNRLNILIVTGLPPFLCLILALFLIQYVFKIKRFVGMQKLFILWGAFHLFNHFFGAFPSGIVTDEGFGYVAAWLYLNTAFKFMFSLISLFVLGAIGFFSAKYILETSDSYHRIKGDHRLSFLLFQLAIPWLAGTIFMLLLRIPENFNYPYETLMLFSMAFMIFPPFFNAKVKPELNLLKIKKKRNINIGYLAMMLVLVAFLRIMLGIGLHFIIEISISISPASA
jgi:hypothetical protein